MGGGVAGNLDARPWRRPRQLFHGVGTNGAESRALQFFCEIAGPFLPGVTDPYFWTQLVMQFSSFEPAVRHSVVAISSLYEQSQLRSQSQSEPQSLQQKPNSKKKKKQSPLSHRGDIRLQDNELALRHYNAAIAELKTMENQSLVLLVCILFICIEFLQSNRDSAIRHCKHGIYILRNNASGPAWVREHLVPLFRRLSIFPFWFGTGADDFPSLVFLEDPIPDAFSTLSDARSMMDDIFSRTIRLVRCGDAHRFGSLRYTKVPPSFLREQEKINYRLQKWRVLFANLDAKSTAPPNSASAVAAASTEQYDVGEEYLNSMLRVYLSISSETSLIWANMAFSALESNYDGYLDNFRRLLRLFQMLHTTLPVESRKHRHYPKFIFEMGFMPMTFFVANKCRDLGVRLATLRLMRLFAVPQENLGRVDITWEVARRVIEIEHGLVVDAEGVPLSPPSHPGLPPDERRVRDIRTEYKESIQTGPDGHQVRGRVVNYFLRTPDDAIYVQTEFFPVVRPVNGESPPDSPWKGPRKVWTRELEVRTTSPTSSPPES